MNRAAFAGIAAAALVAPRAARAQDLAKVRIASGLSDSYFLAYYALEQGFFTKNGLDVEIIQVPGSSAGSTAALAGGAIDIGCTSIGAVANAYLHGIPLRLIAAGGIYTSAAPTTALLVRKESSYLLARDLSGKTIGEAVLKDIQHVSTLKWLDQNGGDSKSINIVELPMSAGSGALANSRIDAYPQIEPYLSDALDSGNFRSIGPIYDAIGSRVMLSVHVARLDWLEKNPALARRFILSLRQAAEWANANRVDANAILQRVTKLPDTAIKRMHHVVQGTTLDVATTQPVIDAFAQYKFIDHRFPIGDFIWTPPR
jgi:NitT/TauT family transport system substrate-binding protein